MRTVSTKEELTEALENNEKVRLTGPLAKKVIASKKCSKLAKWIGGAMVVGGIIAAPFSGGTSLLGSAAGLTIGTVTISATELLMILGVAGGLSAYAISKNYKVTIEKDGTVIIEPA